MTGVIDIEALIAEAKEIRLEDWAREQGWRLGRASSLELVGPCPKCGGTDRFGVNTARQVWNCRKCGVGGDIVYLVQHVEGLKLLPALERLLGRTAAAPADPEEQARRKQRSEAEARRQAEYAAEQREKARRAGYEIFCRRRPVGAAVKAYLNFRGLTSRAFDALVFEEKVKLWEIEALPYRHRIGGEWKTLHVGPAMIAAVQRPDGGFGAVHQTWLDPNSPSGKLALADPEKAGETLPAKKVLGSKKGGAIRLFTPPFSTRPRRLVMGEGIETTLTALVHNFEPDTAYWAGVDLGNMAGRAARSGGHILHDEPDMADDGCFVPPEWCRELVYLCDSDDPETHTEEKVIRGLRRAARARPGLAVAYVPPLGDGRDLNDLVRPPERAVGTSADGRSESENGS